MSIKKFCGVSLVAGTVLLGCSPRAPIFNDAFVAQFSGGLYPIAPGPDVGYVMVMAINNTNDDAIEFVVTGEFEEIFLTLDGSGQLVGYDPRPTFTRTVNLRTDVRTPTLAIVFENTPATFPQVAPGELTESNIRDVLDELASKDPESLLDIERYRLVRLVRIGLGPDLDVPATEDEGIVRRNPGENPDQTAGAILPSNVNNVLSYPTGSVPAEFGNGDIILFLATSSSTTVGGLAISAGVANGEVANEGAAFRRNTFEILRREAGPISPRDTE